jgi:IS30 family transposase
MLVKVSGKDTASVVTALSTQVRHLPSALRRSITWDRGMELAQHKRLTIATKVQVYFYDPQSPWQRGTNENTNRLLRQYLEVAIQAAHVRTRQTYGPERLRAELRDEGYGASV